jgi:hypothetical protein
MNPKPSLPNSALCLKVGTRSTRVPISSVGTRCCASALAFLFVSIRAIRVYFIIGCSVTLLSVFQLSKFQILRPLQKHIFTRCSVRPVAGNVMIPRKSSGHSRTLHILQRS